MCHRISSTLRMKQHFYLLLLPCLVMACFGKSPTENGPKAAEVTGFRTSDSLSFTSGISCVYQDRKGRHWFGSLREGLAVQEGDAFTYLTQEDGLPDNLVQSIQEDKDGRIWIGTQQGVSSFDGNILRSHSPSAYPEYQEAWKKKPDDLWFHAGPQEGVYRFDGQKLRFLPFPNPKNNSTLNVYSVTGFSRGRNGVLWIATFAGVFAFDGAALTVINDESAGFDGESLNLHVRCILEDSKGRLWIGNNGIGVLVKEGERLRNFSEMHGLVDPNSSRNGDLSPPGTLEHVFTIQEDRHGNIWFGDRDAGIWMYDGSSMTNYSVADGLSDDFATAIYEDRDGVLWFGMSNGSVYTFSEKGFEER